MNTSWQPSADIAYLKQRAEILKKIRQFFSERKILEVETPLLCKTTATDPHIASLKIEKLNRYLQTSPEFSMKRLLAAGSGSIYQICKAFRDDECGRYHNPEFTMLEWYHVGFGLSALMQEIDELLQFILQTKPAEKKTYQEIFLQYLNINPHLASLQDLQACAVTQEINYTAAQENDRDTWLHLLLTHCIEPQLGIKQPLFIYDFPASQAALAHIRKTTPPIAERFEVFVNGIELANGYHELIDAEEQRKRFMQDLAQRKKMNYPQVPIDENLLAALPLVPPCAGVALGIDRLMMLAMQSQAIAEVMSFIW